MRRIAVISLAMLLLLVTVVWAAPNQQANLFQLFILETRGDLEALANAQLGEGVRPPEWTFNVDLESATVVVDLWFDNELLADEIFGAGERPAKWFGATSRIPELIVRNVRHDLELSADTVFGEKVRPETWTGAPLIYQCDRTLQNVVRLLGELYNTFPQTPQSVLDYCTSVGNEIDSELLPVIFETIQPSPDQAEQIPALVLAIRGDLERLANEVLGVNNRPSNWVGNVDVNSETLAADIAADLENLATLELGTNERPEEWSAFVSSSVALSYRTLRFNLELLADVVLGEGTRPNGWQGADPLIQCDIIEQALVFITETNFDFVVDQTLASSPNFCELTIFTANSIVENPPSQADIEEQEDMRFTGEAEYAFAYLDPAATEYMGIMPAGTQFRAWYRNFNTSTMMFVSGENFALYIDQRWTTLAEEVFNILPTLEGVKPLAFCDAAWCNGPSPTPTPTGGGPLLALVLGSTAQPTIDPGNIGGPGGTKTRVTWNYIRVTYLLDRPELGVVQVALEICAEPQQVSCEPVTSVFDNALGTAKPVISQYNGLNVYEFRYGYNSNVVIESASRISTDIWISDPTIR